MLMIEMFVTISARQISLASLKAARQNGLAVMGVVRMKIDEYDD